ncbi:MAG: outer membrane lipoprotein LolB [Proteobacteria bacterium]|nr:outer membrane lipoprotein LolB [Pseudomonadota bacterium]
MHMFVRPLGWVLIACFLGSCASSAKFTSDFGDFQRDRSWFRPAELELHAMDAWEMRGRIAVRFDDVGETGNINWNKSIPEQSIRISGPLGVGAVLLTVDALGAEITDQKGNKHFAASAQELLFDATGWILPVENLSYWLQALPGPDGAIEYRVDDNNRLVELRQAGWHIEFGEYKEFNGHQLPAKLTAREGGLDKTRVRLVINSWEWL